MEFSVGIIQGEDFRFARRISWPMTKLTVEPTRLTFTTGFDSVSFEKKIISRLSLFSGFCWLFAKGIQLEHSDESGPPFFVFWAFDLTPIKRSLAENGYVLIEPEAS
jgi:hypothetical protein